MKTLVATFHTPEALMQAAQKAKAEGFALEDTLTPFPVEGIDGVLGLKKANIRRPMALAGFSAAAFAYALEWYSAAIAYPYNSGGRPFNSWPYSSSFRSSLACLSPGSLASLRFSSIAACRALIIRFSMFAVLKGPVPTASSWLWKR